MPEKMRAIPRMTDDEIKQTVEGLVKGHIFTATEIDDQSLLPMVFMPLGLGGASDVDWDQVGNIIEDISKAGPRAINGYPMFLSCRIVHKDDWAVIAERALKVQEAMDAALGGES